MNGWYFGKRPRGLLAAMLTLAATACHEPAATEDIIARADNEQVRNRGASKDDWWDALPRPEWRAFERVDVDTPWFEIYRILPGVTAIYEPGQFEEVISYLIEGAERALLFDTGLGIGDMAGVVAELTDLPVAVLNSHSHYDHVGGNHQFELVYAQDHPYTRERSAGLGHEQVAGNVAPGWIWKPMPDDFDPDTYATAAWEITEHVTDGSVIDLGGRRLEVLATPGHAPDALCLLDREHRLLFTGDTFYPAPLYTHLPGSDFEAYRVSARRLAEIEPLVDHLLPAHNVPLVSSEYLARLDAAFATIAAGEGEYVETDGNREYAFDGFSVIVRGD